MTGSVIPHESFFGAAALHGLESARLSGALDKLVELLLKLSSLIESRFAFPHGRSILLVATAERAINARVRLSPDGSAYVVEFTLGLLVRADAVSAAAVICGEVHPNPVPNELLLIGRRQDIDSADWQTQVETISRILPAHLLGGWESLFQKFLVGVFAHELAHVVRGHVDLLARTTGFRAELDEMNMWGRRNSRAPDLIRLLEFDADVIAARIIAALSIDPPDWLTRWRAGGARHTIIETLSGLCLFFASIEREDQDDGARAETYPRPLGRLLAMLGEMERYWSARDGSTDFYEDIFTGALSVLRLVENVFAEVDMLRDLTDPNVYRTTLEELDGLIDRMETFEPTIIAHAFDGEGLWPLDDIDHARR